MKKTTLMALASTLAIGFAAPAMADEPAVTLPFTTIAANVAVNTDDVDGSVNIQGAAVNIAVDQTVDANIDVTVDAGEAANVAVDANATVDLDGFATNVISTSAFGAVAQGDFALSGGTEFVNADLEGNLAIDAAGVNNDGLSLGLDIEYSQLATSTDVLALNVAYNSSPIDASVNIGDVAGDVTATNLNIKTNAIGAAAIGNFEISAGALPRLR